MSTGPSPTETQTSVSRSTSHLSQSALLAPDKGWSPWPCSQLPGGVPPHFTEHPAVAPHGSPQSAGNPADSSRPLPATAPTLLTPAKTTTNGKVLLSGARLQEHGSSCGACARGGPLPVTWVTPGLSSRHQVLREPPPTPGSCHGQALALCYVTPRSTLGQGPFLLGGSLLRPLAYDHAMCVALSICAGGRGQGAALGPTHWSPLGSGVR